MEKLFKNQVNKTELHHFLILYWAAQAEVNETKYNITNVFDDLKELSITRTKQNAIAYVEALSSLCFIDLKDESNRKNIYLTEFGAKALEELVKNKKYKIKKSRFLEAVK